VRFLLDTNILSDLVRNPQGRVAARIAEVGEDQIGTSIIVAAELRYGAERKASERLRKQLELVLTRIDIVSLETPADIFYGNLRAELERTGQLIGPNDMLIAAQALALQCTIVTDNEREFARVANLPLENWLRDQRD
jgi:tRNA(fMet)-specific endonuclease VapC